LVTSALPNTETENRTYDRAGRITAVTAPNTETAIRADAQLDRVAQTAASHGYSVESHQLGAGMLRFDANPRIARAWERLQNGNPHPSDFDLLAHELGRACACGRRYRIPMINPLAGTNWRKSP
jgi:hypothetical protein